MARRRSKKKGLHPAVAVVFLLASTAFVTKSFWGGEAAPTGHSSQLVAAVDPDMGLETSPNGDDVVWLDLLEEFGSFEEEGAVAHSFAAKVEKLHFAAPGGETQPYVRGRWTGADPPVVRVGVIMVSDASRRAVLNGAVLGVGQFLGSGDAVVAAIRPGSVLVRWGNRDLTYDLDSTAPREFRPELERRRSQTETKEASGKDADKMEEKQ